MGIKNARTFIDLYCEPDSTEIEYPDASKKLVMDCAVGISGLFFSVESMLASGEITGFRESSLASARYLVEKLESRSSDN